MTGSRTGRFLKRLGSGIPEELRPGLPELRMRGNGTVVLEPHRGLRSFSEACVIVAVSGGLLCFHGKGLRIKRMTLRELRLKGEITSLEYSAGHAT